MTSLAELEAQQAQLALAFAQNDKAHVDAIVASLTTPEIPALIEALTSHRDGLSNGSPVRKSTGDLINILTLLPSNFAAEAARLEALINPPAPPQG